MITFENRQADPDKDAFLLSELARSIWSEHYTPIIGTQQVSYMLAQMQSEEAIRAQMAEGFIYCILLVDSFPSGYMAYIINREERELFLSKLYISAAHRRIGAGRYMIGLALQEASRSSCMTIRLTANRNNAGAITAYEKMGFIRSREVITDIGSGFFMDDFEMLLKITS